MTNSIESLTAIIDASMLDYTSRRDEIDRDYISNDIHPFHKFCFNFARTATAQIAHALAFTPPTPPRNFNNQYYFSDSTYDEITNPMTAIDDAQSLFSILYECEPNEFPHLAHRLADHLDYFFDLDDEPDITSIDELNEFLLTD